ncbi:MAG: ABC transporter permease [Phycisphaerales bacterium]|jgi:ABC-2 type transport system permease protein
MGVIARRELAAYFRAPAGWLIIALYLLLSGLVFSVYVLRPNSPASMRDFFTVSGWLLMPVVPAMAMRLFSDEIRAGTLEALLTAPVSTGAVVMGKFTGAMGFLTCMLLPTLVYVGTMYRVSNSPPDPGPIICGYVCLYLIGGAYLAIGTLASSLTANSTLAFMVTLFTILGLLFAAAPADDAPAPVRSVLYSISIVPRIGDFAKGVIDSANAAYFLGITFFCLLGATLALDQRRWG